MGMRFPLNIVGDFDVTELIMFIKARVNVPNAETGFVTPDGFVALIDVNGNELEVDDATMNAAIIAFVPTPPDPDPIDDLVTVLAGPGTVAQKLVGLRTWAEAEQANRRKIGRPPRRLR